MPFEVFNNTQRTITLRSILDAQGEIAQRGPTLKPGSNIITDEYAQAVSAEGANGYVNRLIAKRDLTITQSEPKPVHRPNASSGIDETKKGKGEIVEGGPLATSTPKESIQMIKEEDDLEIVEAWGVGENRAEVLKALQKRIEELSKKGAR